MLAVGAEDWPSDAVIGLPLDFVHDNGAAGITIVRDDWGVPHIFGKTDADAVFGLMYAQAEDDFNRVETNFINSQGRLAEAESFYRKAVALADRQSTPELRKEWRRARQNLPDPIGARHTQRRAQGHRAQAGGRQPKRSFTLPM